MHGASLHRRHRFRGVSSDVLPQHSIRPARASSMECGCAARHERSYRFRRVDWLTHSTGNSKAGAAGHPPAVQRTRTTRRAKAAALPFQGCAAALQKRYREPLTTDAFEPTACQRFNRSKLSWLAKVCHGSLGRRGIILIPLCAQRLPQLTSAMHTSRRSAALGGPSALPSRRGCSQAQREVGRG